MPKRIGTINPEALPIEVFAGDKVRVNRVVFKYAGPAATIYLCWGMILGTDFNNGAALAPAHHFASAAISVPDCPDFIHFDKPIAADLVISAEIPSALYDTWKWLAYAPTDQQAQFVYRAGTHEGLIDPDHGVIGVMADEGEAKDLDVSYVKV